MCISKHSIVNQSTFGWLKRLLRKRTGDMVTYERKLKNKTFPRKQTKKNQVTT